MHKTKLMFGILIICASTYLFAQNIGDKYSFDSKNYVLSFYDDFNYPTEKIKENWYLDYISEPEPTIRGTDNYMSRKITGTKFDWETTYPIPSQLGKNYIIKDGVLSIIHTRDFNETTKEYTFCLPAIRSIQTWPMGTLVEIKYKMERKGQAFLYQIHCDQNSLNGNEKNYIFSNMWGCEMLTNAKDQVNYHQGWFVGKITDKKASEAARKDVPTDLAKMYNIEWDNEANGEFVWKNHKGTTLPDEKFYEWHTCYMRYDEEGWTIWHDDIKFPTLSWKITGTPSDDFRVALESNIAGDWTYFSPDAIQLVGEWDDSIKSNAFYIDYVKVYTDETFLNEKDNEIDIYTNYPRKGINVTSENINVAKDKYYSQVISLNSSKANRKCEFMFTDNISIKNNYVLEMDVKTKDKKLNLPLYINNEEYSFTVTNNDVPATGKWTTIQIPLYKMNDFPSKMQLKSLIISDAGSKIKTEIDNIKISKKLPEKFIEEYESVNKKNWIIAGKETGEYVLYEGYPNTDIQLLERNISKAGITKAKQSPIIVNTLDTYADFGLSFDLTDLSELKDSNYALEMDIKTNEKNLEIIVGLYNSKQTAKYEWKNEKTLTNNQIPADGEWHKIRIPLKALTPGWIWDGEINDSVSPELSEFDWKNVYKLLINNGPNPLAGGLEINNIRIVK